MTTTTVKQSLRAHIVMKACCNLLRSSPQFDVAHLIVGQCDNAMRSALNIGETALALATTSMKEKMS